MQRSHNLLKKIDMLRGQRLYTSPSHRTITRSYDYLHFDTSKNGSYGTHSYILISPTQDQRILRITES